MSSEFGLCLPATGIPNCAAAAKDEFPLPRPVRHQPVSGVRVLVGRVRAALNGRPRDNGELIPLSGGDFVVAGSTQVLLWAPRLLINRLHLPISSPFRFISRTQNDAT